MPREVSSSRGTSQTPITHKRTYQACKACRTSKLRCDLGDPDSPSEPPCRRCLRTGRECTFGGVYQRVEKGVSVSRTLSRGQRGSPSVPGPSRESEPPVQSPAGNAGLTDQAGRNGFETAADRYVCITIGLIRALPTPESTRHIGREVRLRPRPSPARKVRSSVSLGEKHSRTRRMHSVSCALLWKRISRAIVPVQKLTSSSREGGIGGYPSETVC